MLNYSNYTAFPSPIVSHNYYSRNDASDLDDTFNWTWDRIVLIIILSLITVGTVIGNLLVLIHFVKNLFSRGLQRIAPTHFFIANLSLADLSVGILVLPYLTIYQVTGKWYFGQNLCTVWVFYIDN